MSLNTVVKLYIYNSAKKYINVNDNHNLYPAQYLMP